MNALVVGVVAGVIASVLFAALTQFFRPRLKLSPTITRTPAADPTVGHRYRAKIVNVGRRAAVDVQVRAYVVRERRVPTKDDKSSGVVRVKRQIELRRGQNGVIARYRRRDKNASYAHRIRFEQSAVAELDDPEQATYLLLTVTARDGVSGLPRMFEQEYRISTQIQDGTFCFGREFKVVPWTTTQARAHEGAESETEVHQVDRDA